MEPTITIALIGGIVALITKSTILLVLAGLIFLLGFIPFVSLPTPVWIVVVLVLIYSMLNKK